MLGWEVIPRIGFGNLTVSPHGLGIALGYFAGTMLLARRARARGFSEDHAWNAAAISVVGAILGARIAYVIGHFSEFDSPLEWLQIYKGGISLIGGLLGGFFAALLYVRKRKLDFFELSDLGAPGIAIGIAIGRIGDLVIGDHLGKATDGWWGWQFKGGELISPPRCIYPTGDGCITRGLVVHQTALYDMIWSLVIFGLLMALDRKPRPRGFLTLTWASLYAAGRIATDFTRVDKNWFGLGLTGSQLTSIAVLGVCSYFLFKQRQLEPAPVGVPAEAPTERVLGRASSAASETAVEAEAPAAAERVLRRRDRDAATPAAATTTTQEKPRAQPRRKAAAQAPESEATPTSIEPAGQAAPTSESVFRTSRERSRTRTETGGDRPEEASERRRSEEAERLRSSSRSEPSPSEASTKPAEKPVDDDLEDFDWEP